MRTASLWRYAIPLDAGVVLRDQRIKQRSGLVVRLRDGSAEGWGEIAPLPGFSHEDLPQAQDAAEAWLTSWCAGDSAAESRLPSVAFGLSCALAELDGTLPAAGNYHSAALCVGDPDQLFARLQALPYPVAKMKVGLYEPIRDGMLVSLLLEALPDLQLRLDANRSWSPEKARQFARAVGPELRQRIAFLEEPCRTPAESCSFSAETAIAIAWDESVREAGFVVAAQPGVTALVVKPTLTGSIRHLQQLITAAQQQGLTVVISSAIESSLGLTQLARLANWLTPQVLPGLDTLDLMQHQLHRRWPDSSLALQALADREAIWRG
ncbi:o-succinylbenzoate synthase [Erwiniaceae bacterium BAC15a-03b]|uniref:o-succinylbenzoate synthase n=1 Tax=Winslowiella arboricola TaxID=2978220 RepID=A0A9J6PMW0_9GAMM|nr:o-succinylbenzoate synthase [Winslowiella arboricola]MCU5771316.1 o-succinylbenzoate synthase [Winslowiella arboricola]MCU5777053.1 o-succinylbenzoate synthase [Winslowiella arboricola]